MEASLGTTKGIIVTKRRTGQICVLDRSLPTHVEKGFKGNGFNEGLSSSVKLPGFKS